MKYLITLILCFVFSSWSIAQQTPASAPAANSGAQVLVVQSVDAEISSAKWKVSVASKNPPEEVNGKTSKVEDYVSDAKNGSVHLVGFHVHSDVPPNFRITFEHNLLSPVSFSKINFVEVKLRIVNSGKNGANANTSSNTIGIKLGAGKHGAKAELKKSINNTTEWITLLCPRSAFEVTASKKDGSELSDVASVAMIISLSDKIPVDFDFDLAEFNLK